MFFTDEVLHARNGRFGVIWLAATKKDLLKKRQYENENVEETCGELQKHFKPKLTGGMMTIAGFSLRLSAQLAFGVTVVYHLQVSSLYKEVHLTFQNLTRYRPHLSTLSIDLDTKKQKSYDKQQSVPENYLQNDPTFGEFSGPPCDEFAPIPLKEVVRDEGKQQHVVTDISTITLPEELPAHMTDFTFDGGHGAVVDEPDPDFVNFMGFGKDTDKGFMEIGLQTTNIETPFASTLPPIPKEVPKTPTKDRKRKTSVDDSVLAVPIVDPEVPGTETLPPEQATVSPPQDPDLSRQAGDAHDVQSSKSSSNATSELILEPVEDVAKSVKKQKKIKLFDKQTELTSDEIRNQLRTVNTKIEDYIAQGFLEEPKKMATAKELFANPGKIFSGTSFYQMDEYLHTKNKDRLHSVQALSIPARIFNQQAREIEENLLKTRPKHSFSAHKEAMKEEFEHPEDIYTEMIDGPKFEDTLPDLTVDSLEYQRNVSKISGLDITHGTQSDFEHPMINNSENVESVLPGKRPSFLEEVDLGSSGESMRKPKVVSPPRLLGELLADLGDNGIMFSSIAPPGVTTKPVAAQLFFDLLMLAKEERVCLKQETHYSDFRIYRV